MTGRASEARRAATLPTGAARSRWPPPLHAAVGVATIVVGGNVVVLAVGGIDAPRVVATLLALACLCVSLLAVGRAPSVAWVAAIVGSYAASTLTFERARLLGAEDALEGWIAVAIGSSLCAVATVGIAAGYVARPAPRLAGISVPVAAVAVVWVVVACATTIALVVAGLREADPAFTWVDVATVPISIFLPVVLLLAGIGVAADVRAAAARARDRMVRRRTMPAPGSPGRAWILGRATVRELVPGQATVDEAAHEAERSRLAGDLHASVLPALRRAIADAEAGGDPEELARRLRLVDVELERLMADRWPIVLEEFGLVLALEELAERLEADGAPPVTIEVERSGERPPAAVERAAWRFAQVVLDNAVRHAAATAIGVSVEVESAVVRIVVIDDGTGLEEANQPGGTGRGLVDARRTAAEAGATVSVADGPGGGTVARFDWAAGHGPDQGRP